MLFQPSPTDRVIISWLERILLAWDRRKRRARLLADLSAPRLRPLDRRNEPPFTFEDRHATGRVLFSEHEDGLSLNVGEYGGPTILFEIDNWHARALCRYLNEKVGRIPRSNKHEQLLQFHDKKQTGYFTFDMHGDDLRLTAYYYGGATIRIDLDNWHAGALCRYLDYRVEGKPL